MNDEYFTVLFLAHQHGFDSLVFRTDIPAINSNTSRQQSVELNAKLVSFRGK